MSDRLGSNPMSEETPRPAELEEATAGTVFEVRAMSET